MIVLDFTLGIVAAVAFFYWIASAVIDIVVIFVRCRGDSSSSAVPAVATLTGGVVYIICLKYFHLIESPHWLLAFLLPDILYELSEAQLWVRIHVFKWPDKAVIRPRPTNLN